MTRASGTGFLRRFGLLAVAAAIAAVPCLAGAAEAKGKLRQIRIAYVAPKNPEHRPLYDLMRAQRVLERLQEFLSPLRLPSALTLKLEGCDGVSNAWYSENAILVCYEYLHDAVRSAPTEPTPFGITRTDYLAGIFFDVYLHELGHAVFDLLKIPVFGREEDAADLFSAYVLLQFPKEDARRLIGGIAFGYGIELKLKTPADLAKRDAGLTMQALADVHAATGQRFYNIMCIAYGADPEVFSVLVERDVLPKSRADGCEYEYEQVAYAWRMLIAPHIDPQLARKVRAKHWIPEVTARPEPRAQPGSPAPKP